MFVLISLLSAKTQQVVLLLFNLFKGHRQFCTIGLVRLAETFCLRIKQQLPINKPLYLFNLYGKQNRVVFKIQLQNECILLQHIFKLMFCVFYRIEITVINPLKNACGWLNYKSILNLMVYSCNFFNIIAYDALIVYYELYTHCDQNNLVG